MMHHTYHVACTRKAFIAMSLMTLERLESYIEQLTAEECEENLTLFSSFLDREAYPVKQLGERFVFIREVPADYYADFKGQILSKTVDEDDLSRFVECKTCGNIESQPFDQQRHHYGSFTHLGEDKYTCHCKSKAVEVDVGSDRD